MSNWRWPSWLIAVWTVLLVLFMVFVFISGINDKTENYEPSGFLIGCVILGIILWLVPMIVLAPIWYFTGKRQARCPGCGSNVQKSWYMCPRCGYRPPMPAYGPYPAMPGQVPSPYPGPYASQVPAPFAPPAPPWTPTGPAAYPQQAYWQPTPPVPPESWPPAEQH